MTPQYNIFAIERPIVVIPRMTTIAGTSLAKNLKKLPLIMNGKALITNQINKADEHAVNNAVRMGCKRLITEFIKSPLKYCLSKHFC